LADITTTTSITTTTTFRLPTWGNGRTLTHIRSSPYQSQLPASTGPPHSLTNSVCPSPKLSQLAAPFGINCENIYTWKFKNTETRHVSVPHIGVVDGSCLPGSDAVSLGGSRRFECTTVFRNVWKYSPDDMVSPLTTTDTHWTPNTFTESM
jgi:hypothetical protein